MEDDQNRMSKDVLPRTVCEFSSMLHGRQARSELQGIDTGDLV